MNKNNEWIQKSIILEDVQQIEELIDVLAATSGINLVSECHQAMFIADKYKEDGNEIPPGLVKAIQLLYNKPSGYTGLSVWEAYSLELRKNSSK